MQSFLQYRRFKKHSTRQYERNREKAEALRRGNDALGPTPSPVSPSTTANPSPATSDKTIDTRDPEKAEHSKCNEAQNKAKSLPPIAEEATEEEEHLEPHPPLISSASTAATQRTMGTALETALTGINVRKRTTRESGDKGNVSVAGYEGKQDKQHPHLAFLNRLNHRPRYLALVAPPRVCAFAYGILCVCISSYLCIIDSYEAYAASATRIRYVAKGGMVEVKFPFEERLGVHWTLTVLGASGAVCVPVPYLWFCCMGRG